MVGFRARIADRALDLAGGDIECRDQGLRAMRLYSYSRRSILPGFIGRPGATRSSACTPLISSIDTVRTPCSAASGACR